MLAIPVVLIAIVIAAAIFREGMKDGTADSRGWGLPIVAAVGAAVCVAAVGVLLSWGAALT